MKVHISPTIGPRGDIGAERGTWIGQKSFHRLALTRTLVYSVEQPWCESQLVTLSRNFKSLDHSQRQ